MLYSGFQIAGDVICTKIGRCNQRLLGLWLLDSIWTIPYNLSPDFTPPKTYREPCDSS
jgi:hypothetical protein